MVDGDTVRFPLIVPILWVLYNDILLKAGTNICKIKMDMNVFIKFDMVLLNLI